MEIIKRNKTAQRTSFTKCYNTLENLLNESNVDVIELEMSLHLFKQKDDALEQTHQNYLNGLVDEKEFQTEYEAVESYREKSVRIKLRAQMTLDNIKCSQLSKNETKIVSNSDENKYEMPHQRLPKIELYKFGGRLTDWLSFWNQFQKIHESKSLNNADKFHYLIQSTETGSEAREIVESFPVTNENYSLAIESLKERYGNKNVLIDVYVRELLALVLNNANKSKQSSLSNLYNKLSTQLRALSSLGVTSDQCGVILYPLVESALPLETLKIWERQRKQYSENSESKLSDLDAILLFLRNEVQSEERIKLCKTELIPPVQKLAPCHSSKNRFVPSAAQFINHKTTIICLFCKGSHDNKFCKKAYFIPLDEKMFIIKKNALCLSCLHKNHISKFCRYNIKCSNCSKNHVKFMCPDLDINKAIKEETEEKGDSKVKSLDSLHSMITNEVFLQTLMVKIKGKKGERQARLLIDTGAQRSYILKSTANELGFDLQGTEEFSHSLFGGAKTKPVSHKCYKIYLSDLRDNYRCSLDALDQDLICNDIPSIRNGSWMRELKSKNIYLTDVQRGSRPIEILLGSDVAGKLITGRREVLESGLVALETKLGWSLLGKVPQTNRERNINMTVTSMLSLDSNSVSRLWDLELLGIRDPIEQKSKEESKEAVLMFFEDTLQQLEDGRYEVSMPWKSGHDTLPDNYDLSLRRLDSTYKKLEKTDYRKEYQEVFKEWIHEGIIEEVKEKESPRLTHYLPHRPVIKENSSTKIRPVFDGSAKLPNSPSLNDCLETGINLIETIPSILAKFRENKIGVISDIKKAFLQISVNKKDRDFLRFLLYDNENNVKVFQHNRVVFGVTCSPFLLGAVINHHLSRKSLFDQYSGAMLEKLRDSFYVDNCVTSVENCVELKLFIETATEIMEKGKFELRRWENTATDEYVIADPKTNVLGLIWDKYADCLEIDSKFLNFDENDKVTKRKILALVSQVFDPIGVISPALIKPKMLLQKTWEAKEPWDKEVNHEIRNAFLKWIKELPYLKEIKIPRWLGITSTSKISLHTFVDASQTAYATCIFVRSESSDNVISVRLIQAKSRISPLKQVTIPRMELMAATIGARLWHSTRQALKLDIVDSYFWTDSSTVLTWIKHQEQWSVFVNNRVKEIRSLTAPESWFHIPGEQNIADLPSRGCGIKQLSKSVWWEGPTWLRNSEEHWPKSNVNLNAEEIAQEKRRTVISANSAECESIISRLANRVSKFSKIVRIIAWTLRFRPKAKEFRKCINLSDKEISNAQKVIFRSVQTDSFFDEDGRKPLANFQVYNDDDGILRLRSRLTNEDETYDFICPVILPSKHLVVKRLIEEEHILNKHTGAFTLLTILRERFWIIKGKRTIRSIINECIVCKKQKVKHLEVPFPPLPQDRTRVSAVFEVSGVDLAGPLLTKSKEKVWIVLFSCAVFRAVHLELIPSLSASAFIQALRRFIARRGRVSVLYSDNGTNFTGLNKALKNLDWTEIQRTFEVKQIRWKFNPPSAPWWGGFWERLIRILKDLIKRNLGYASLTHEELHTLICECESIMNNRPLTYISEDHDLRTLTPSSFLQDLRNNDVPDLDQIEKTNIVKRWKYIQRMRESLKQRFRKEYLGFLRSTIPKKHNKIQIGDIVLIGSEDKKRLFWPLAKVIEVFPSKDGVIRLVKLKTSKGDLLRPVQRLYPLEVTQKCEKLDVNFEPTSTAI